VESGREVKTRSKSTVTDSKGWNWIFNTL